MTHDTLLLMIRASSPEDGSISIFREQQPDRPTGHYKLVRERRADTVSKPILEPFNSQIAAHVDAIIRLADEARCTYTTGDQEVIS